jgi:hypothetical protein
MMWRAQWLVVGGCMVAVEVAVGTLLESSGGGDLVVVVRRDKVMWLSFQPYRHMSDWGYYKSHICKLAITC